MRTTPNRLLLVAVAGWFAAGVLGASPAAGAVTCGDLRNQGAARSYLQNPAADAALLDSDADGRACEARSPLSDGKWTLLGLGVLVVAVYARHRVTERRRLDTLAAGVRTWTSAGSFDRFVGTLKRVPPARRLPLVEEHALSHGVPPQLVLDALAESDRDLALQRWALVGYGAPAHVRVMTCSCVGGVRNFRLTTQEGESTWACASCGSEPSHLSGAINPRPLGTTRKDVDQK